LGARSGGCVQKFGIARSKIRPAFSGGCHFPSLLGYRII
jgi:hypothetical protein